MSLKEARESLGAFAHELEEAKGRLSELEAEVVRKSETLARLERSKENPVSGTASIVHTEIDHQQQEHEAAKDSCPQHPHIRRSLIGGLRDLQSGLAKIALRPTQTKVSNNHALPDAAPESLRATEIEPWLFLAGNIIARDAEAIRSKGITRILNAAHTVCPNYHEGQFEYISFDLIDHPSESIEHFLLRAIAEMERAREDGVKLLVHCHQGVSRSATLVIAYLAWKDNLSIMDALVTVKSRRRIVKPNAGFMAQLERFETRLRGIRTEPVLFNVLPHSDQVSALVLKEIYDKNRPMIDEDDVFVLYEGQGGDLLLREPKERAANYEDAMAVARRTAQWMIRFEATFRFATIVEVPYDDPRFAAALGRLPEDQREHLYPTATAPDQE